MGTTHKKIEFYFGDISSAVKELTEYKERGELGFIEFNGQNLYSDVDDLDSAYIKITGKTKAECDEEERIRHEEYQEQQRKHKEAIPELTKKWIEKGNIIHNDGTKTDVYKSVFHRAWAHLKIFFFH